MIRDSVFEALNNAQYSGYTELLSVTVGEIVDDLLMYDSELENCSEEEIPEIAEAVREWLSK